MPLLEGKPHNLVEIPKNAKFADRLFIINTTGEIFLNESDYNDRKKIYDDAKWVCKCTGKDRLTYQEAVKSEREVRNKIKKQIPAYFAKAIFDVANKSKYSLENLVEASYTKLSATLAVGEEVAYKSKDKIFGTILKVHGTIDMSCNDKENALKLKPSKVSELLPTLLYDLKTSDDRDITSVAAYNLNRTGNLPTRDMIQNFIKANFSKKSNDEWVVDPDSNLKQRLSAEIVKSGNATGKSPMNQKLSLGESDRKLSRKKKFTENIPSTSPLNDFLANTKKQPKAEPEIIRVSPMKKNTSNKSNLAKGKKSGKKAGKTPSKEMDAKKSSSNSAKNKAKSIMPSKKVNSKKDSNQVGGKKRKVESSDKATPKKKMKQMTLLDMSIKSTSSSKSGSDTPVKKLKAPVKNKDSPNKLMKAASKKTLKTPKAVRKLKKPLSTKKSPNITKTISKTKMLTEKKQNCTIEAVPSENSHVEEIETQTPLLNSPSSPNSNLQEKLFRMAMIRLLHVKANFKQDCLSRSIRKALPLYEPKFDNLIPEELKEAFLRRVEHASIKNMNSTLKGNFQTLKTATTSKGVVIKTNLKPFSREMQFKTAMKRLLYVHANCSQKHFSKTLGKMIPLYETQFHNLIPRKIREVFLRRVAYAQSKKQLLEGANDESNPEAGPSGSNMQLSKQNTITKTPTLIASNTNLQEMQFKISMKRLLRVKANCGRRHFSKTIGKAVHLYEPKFNSLVPEQIQEVYFRRLDQILSKRNLEDIKPELREEFLARQAAEAEKKKSLELGKKLNKGSAVDAPLIDDKLLENLAPLPKPKLVSTPEGLPNELFGDVIMITEFIGCYQGLLVPKSSSTVYADQLMDALVAGTKSFGVLSQVLVLLLQTLLHDEIAMDYEESVFKLNDIPVNEYTAAELVRLSLRTDDSAEVNTANEEEIDVEKAPRNDEVPEELLSEIEATEFYELEPVSKLKIINGLCHRVLSTYIIQEHKNGVHKKFSEILARKKMDIKEENEKKNKQGNDEGKSEEKSPDASKNEDAKPEAQAKTEDFNQLTVEADDLISKVKNRKLLAKKALEEKEKEEQLKKQKQEDLKKEIEKQNLHHDYQDALMKWKRLERLNCVGLDRNYDRYWVLASVQPILCVEKGWSSYLDYKVEREEEEQEEEISEISEDEESEQDSLDDSSGESPAQPVPPVNDQSTLPTPGQNLWFCYDSLESVDELMKSLGPGIREKQLKSQLNRFYATMKKHSLKKWNDQFVGETDSQDKLLTGLQDELVDFASEVKKGGMGCIEKFDSWTEKVKKTKSIKGLGKCLLDVRKSILPRFFSKVFNQGATKADEDEGKKSANKIAKWWEEAIANCQTLSRLHVLASILDSCVKWDESSANIKCKVCRCKNCETATIVCKKCRSGYHLSCLRPALSAIPDVDWYCPACELNSAGLRSSKKNYAEGECEDGADDKDEDYINSEEEEEEKQCAVCGGADEELISCSRCPSSFHLDCHQPPLRNPPRGMWACCQCVSGKKIKRKLKGTKKSNNQRSLRHSAQKAKPSKNAPAKRRSSRLK